MYTARSPRAVAVSPRAATAQQEAARLSSAVGCSAWAQAESKVAPPWMRRLNSPRAALRRTLPPANYALPPSRADATSLLQELRATLESSAGDRVQTEEAWQKAFVEIVRQVYVHCTERGELLEAIRVWFDGQLQLHHRMINEQLKELKQLRGRAQLMQGRGTGTLDDRMAAREAALNQAEGVSEAEALRKRLDLIMEGARTLPPAAKSTLVEELFDATSVDDKQLVTKELMGFMQQSDKLLLLGSELEELAIEDLMQVPPPPLVHPISPDFTRPFCLLAVRVPTAGLDTGGRVGRVERQGAAAAPARPPPRLHPARAPGAAARMRAHAPPPPTRPRRVARRRSS